jgi:hypothetical protein
MLIFVNQLTSLTKEEYVASTVEQLVNVRFYLDLGGILGATSLRKERCSNQTTES